DSEVRSEVAANACELRNRDTSANYGAPACVPAGASRPRGELAMVRATRRAILTALLCAACCIEARGQSDSLPSWNDGATKTSITDFVARVTAQGGADFVPPAERIATFDNDGTLWCEQPVYVQVAFVFDRVKALSAQHPEWKTKQPFRAVLAGDQA